MSHDEAFIQDILAHPDDLGLRLIYADWLDEHDDPRGAFLRAEAEYRALPEDDERRPATRELLREMAEHFDGRWRTRLDLPMIENCSVTFVFECPQRWQELRETGDSTVRFCGECRKRVYYCGSVPEARQHAWQGHCVAVDTQQERRAGDLEPEIVMGLMRPPEAQVVEGLPRDLANLRRGQHVIIRGGDYDGLAGRITRVHALQNRTTIRIHLGGKPTFITVDLDQLEPIE